MHATSTRSRPSRSCSSTVAPASVRSPTSRWVATSPTGPRPIDHDLVLVDTRGTGISHPRLGCRELDRADVLAFYAGKFVNDKTPRIIGRALDRCWQRYTDRGIDLADYNSRESAADLEALRRALGIDQWNLLAISADGTLGLTYMRRFPDGIRSAIIDSGMAPNALWGLDYHVGAVQILNRVFAGCRANAACRARYPGIRRLFERKAQQLNRDPVFIDIPRMRPEPVRLLVDGATIYSDALSLVYPGDIDSGRPWPAPSITRGGRPTGTCGGSTNVCSAPVRSRTPTKTTSWRAARRCRTSAATTSGSLLNKTGRRPRRRHRHSARASSTPASTSRSATTTRGRPRAAATGRVGRAGPLQHELVESAIPTLVLANRCDLGVPPRMVKPMLPGLSSSTYVVLPAGFHLSLAVFTNGSECARDDRDGVPGSSRTLPPTPPASHDLPHVDFTPPDRSPRLGVLPRWQRVAPGRPPPRRVLTNAGTRAPRARGGAVGKTLAGPASGRSGWCVPRRCVRSRSDAPRWRGWTGPRR